MATVTRENINGLHDKITVKLAKEDYLPSFEKSLKQYAKSVNVPGFRKGMVPTGMVKKMYGPSIFNEEVIRSASRKMEDYLNAEKLAIFAQPMLMPDSNMRLDMNDPQELDFSFEIGLKPDFEIPVLEQSPTITKYKIMVEDKLVADEVDRIRRRYGKVEDLEAINSKDDIIYSTYEACDENGNVLAESQKVDDTEIVEKLPAKLQELLMTQKAGDTIVFKPEDIAEGKELENFLKDPLKQGMEAAGQYYKLTITKAGLMILHELDEELYAQVFPNQEVSTEANFTDLIRKELSKEYERISNEQLQNEIFEILVHQTPLQLPVDFLKRWMREGGEKPKSESEVEKEYPSFDHQLRWTLISDKLIKDNNIEVTIDEVNSDIKKKVLGYFGMEADEDAPWLESYMAKVAKDEKTMDETYRRILYDKLFQFLETKFNIQEKEISEEEFFKQEGQGGHHHHH